MDLPDNIPTSAGLTTRGETEVSEAVQACVKRCMGQSDPAACAKQFCKELVAAGWTPLDARQVEIGAMRIAANLSGDDSLYPEPY
jgi:hypothetical protein